MERLLFAAFTNTFTARKAARELKGSGYDLADVSLINRNNSDQVEVRSIDDDELQGGFVEALTGMGLSLEETMYYLKTIQGGGAFLIVPVDDGDQEDIVRAIFFSFDAHRVSGAALARL